MLSEAWTPRTTSHNGPYVLQASFAISCVLLKENAVGRDLGEFFSETKTTRCCVRPYVVVRRSSRVRDQRCDQADVPCVNYLAQHAAILRQSRA